MPPSLLIDFASVDLNQVEHDQEAIRRVNPQRGDMEHLNGVIFCDGIHILGFKDVRDDEFWVAGHVPGRPLLPGVIMLEAAAQLASFYAHKYLGWDGFVGFGGLDNVRFRAAVPPGKRLYVLCKMLDHRHRRVWGNTQGIVDGNIVFEADVIGVRM